MTTINRIPIRSYSSNDAPHPWYPMAVDPRTLVITFGECNCRGGRCAISGTTLDVKNASAKVRRVPVTFADGTAHMPRYFIYLDLAGTLHVGTEADELGIIQAHLGWYDPDADVLDLLEFHDIALEDVDAEQAKQ